MTTSNHPVVVVIADGELDGIFDAGPETDTHAKDLRAFGCRVRRETFPSWPAAQAWADEWEAQANAR